MFTTGSKLFLGATAASTVGALVWGACNGGAAGVAGVVGLAALAIAFAFLAGMNLFTRDGNVLTNTPNPEATGAAQRAGGNSMWPLVTAIGVGGLVIGAVSRPVVFKVSVVVLLAALAEWMIQGFAERASADANYNKSVRQRLLNPLEFPVLGAFVLAVIVYGFSRVMLTSSKSSGRIVFIVIGAIVVFAAFVLAARRGVGKGATLGISVVAAVALLGVGIASAVSGQRTIERHPEVTSAVCLGKGSPEQEAEIDKNASQNVALKSSVVANVVLEKGNKLVAFINGIPTVEYHEILTPRSAVINLLFRNETEIPRRLTARLGSFKQKDGTVGPEEATCSTRIGNGKEAFLSFKLTKLPGASSTPYELIVPGLDNQKIQLQVP